MHSILILNSKGGCGKTTLATNLAGYCAVHGKSVALADFDPLASSLDWLARRPPERPPIHGIAAFEGALRAPKDTDILILDTPSGVHGSALTDLVRRAETLVIPLLPSPLDIRAANRFLASLLALHKVIHQGIKLTTVANRVRAETLAAEALEGYLEGLTLPDGHRLPHVAVLRQSTHYVQAAERGLSIFEFAPAAMEIDRSQWAPLLRWLHRVRPHAESHSLEPSSAHNKG